MAVLAYNGSQGSWPRPSVQMGGWSVPDERGGQDSSGGNGPGGTRLCGHSFIIRAATMAAQQGLRDSLKRP